MSLVKFLADESVLEADIFLEGHRVQLTFKDPVTAIESMISMGFYELNEFNQTVMSDFSNHKYLYHEETPHFEFIITDEADDVWHEQPFVPPTPPTPPPEPTLEEVKESKIVEMQELMATAISDGIVVVLSDGTEAIFGLSSQNQTSLTNLRLMAEQAEDKETPSIPWHPSDEAAHCVYYSPNDIIKITDAAILYTTYQITFFRDLRIYINSLTTKEAVEAIIYDISVLPYGYWSDVLKDIVNQMNASHVNGERG